MRPSVLCLQHLLVPFVWLLGPLALAHEGHFDIADLQVIDEGGERFLGMRVTYGEHDTPLSFSAALIDGEEAILEVRREGSYQTAERLEVGRGEHVFDATSPLRVRLPDGLTLPRDRQAHTATLLFEPGFLVSHQVLVESAEAPWSRAWQVSLVLGALMLLGAGLWLVARRRMQPLP